jgi:L-threonylcarbamoyladenylate synthase
MKIIKIDPKNPDEKLINLVAEEIRKGRIVVYPTDTLYGIGVNALDEKSVKKVFEIKGRNFNKPISIAFSSLKDVKKYVKFDPISLKLAKKILPGPLTLILPLKKKIPEVLTKGKKEVGVRIPDNKIALELIKKCGFPLTSTSANLSGEKNPINSKEAIKQIGNKVDLVIDSGKSKYSKSSTVVKVVDGKIEIIREGTISKRKLFWND